MTDVANYIDKISSNKKVEEMEICPMHEIQNLYYCSECKIPLCSDCYMLEDKHKKHKIKKIDDVYKSHLELIKKEKEGLDIEENTLRKYLKDINEKIIEIGNTKYKKIKEIEEFFKNIRNQIQTQNQELITNLLEKKQNIEEKLNEIQKYMKDFSYQIKNSSKNEIISQSSNLIKTLKDIKLKLLTENSDINKFPNNFSLDIQNPLVPKYETGIFEIQNFENINSDKVMYSPEMRIGGLLWKMKLYPKGNQTSKGEYISLFLELQSGLKEPSKYYYILEMINFKKRRNYFMEYSSNFINGECWGYSKFYKIDKLKEDGFLNENGDMILKVHIRAESFEQLSRDLKGYIDILEKKVNESAIGEEDEESDEEGDEDDDELEERNITINNNIYDLILAKDFLLNSKNNKDKDKKLENDKKSEKNKKKKNSISNSIYKNKNFSFDDFDLNKGNKIYHNCQIGKDKDKDKVKANQKQEKKKEIIISKKNNLTEACAFELNNHNNIKNKDKDNKINNNNKKYNNSQIVLSTKETDNNSNNINNIFKTEKKNPNENNGLLSLNNNYINNFNNINIIKEEKKLDNKNSSNNLISPINNIKLSNIAKIDVSSDSEEEQKKMMKEDPYLIPKDKEHPFILSDDSFEFLVESMKFNDEKKEKNNIMPEEKFNDLNNNINYQYQNLIKNLEKNRNKERDRNRDKEYGRIRNSNNNYERNYMPYRNYYNYYGNGQINNDVNSPSGKFPNNFEYKKNYFK